MMATEERNDQTPDDGADRSGESAALRGADAAVRRVLVEVHRDLLHLLQRRPRNPDEAEEVLQRFVVRAIERAAELRDVRTVRGRLGRILATTIVDHQRRAIRTRQREVSMEPEALDRISGVIAPDPEVDGIVCDCLHRLLPTLRPEYADVIWRADVLGEPRDRIAASLGTSINNVSVRLFPIARLHYRRPPPRSRRLPVRMVRARRQRSSSDRLRRGRPRDFGSSKGMTGGCRYRLSPRVAQGRNQIGISRSNG
jgi:DNA-directed RNA polymerase specialized sigma24 family protein